MDAANCVLRDPSLIVYIASFQRGLPYAFYQILQKKSRFPTCGRQHSDLWRQVMLNGELRLVQKLYSLKKQSEFASNCQVQRVDLPVCATVCGRVDVLQWLGTTEAGNEPWNHQLLRDAMQTKQFKSARWLLQNHPQSCDYMMCDSMTMAVRARDVELLKIMHAVRPESAQTHVTTTAASCGNMEIVATLHSLTMKSDPRLEQMQYYEPWSYRAMDAAAAKGHLEVVKFLHYHRSEGCTTNAMDQAATNGHLDVVRFLHENRSEGCTTNAIDGAAKFGHREVVKFLVENRDEGCTEAAVALAALNNQFETLVLLHETFGVTVTRDWDVISKAFCRGRMDIALYLRDVVRVRFVKRELNAAILSGRVGLVKFLHDNKPKRSTDEAIMFAGVKGNAEIIDYLLLHRDQPVSQRTFDVAVESNRVALVKRLHEKYGLTTSHIRHKSYKNLDFVKYLHEVVRVPLPTLEQVASLGSMEVIQYIWEKEGGNLTVAIEQARRQERNTVVKYLQDQTPVDSPVGVRLRRRTSRHTNRMSPY